MHILGLSNGSVNGNCEIALKASLKAAQEADSSITTSWVHVPSVSIPPNPKPLQGQQDISLGRNASMLAGEENKQDIPDDRLALMNAILDADAFIFATPIYSHSPAGSLKAVFDRICGPYTDAVFADIILRSQKAGEDRFAHMTIDERRLKPRVAAFIAIGGSSVPDQVTMALPILHTLVYPMHVKVVDQVVFYSCGTPGSILTRAQGSLIERAAQVGKNIVSQIGKPFDEAHYLGDEPDGACPHCHLAKIDMFYGPENKIGCIACGAQGHLKVDEDGVIRPRWNENCGVSSITWAGKELHIEDIQKSSLAEVSEIQDCKDFDVQRQRWKDYEVPHLKLLSLQ